MDSFKPYHYLKYFGVNLAKINNYFEHELNQLKEKDAIRIDTSGGFGLYRTSKFDSDILKKNVGKVDHIVVAENSADEDVEQLVADMISSFKENNLDYVTCRLSAANIKVIHGLEKNGFQLVDGYLVLLQQLKVIEGESSIVVREATEEDIPVLQKIAPTFIYSRFFRDQLVGEEAATKMHEEWIKNSVLKKVADQVFVAEVDGQVIGFVTVEIDHDSEQYLDLKMGHIPLIGVAREYRGQHIAQVLTRYVMNNYFKEENVAVVRIETQLINVPATRTYEQLGFRMVDSALTFRWSKK